MALSGGNSRITLPPAIAASQQNSEMVAWERQARRIDVNWHSSQAGKPAYLSGLDLQRAPVFGGFSLGLALSAACFGLLVWKRSRGG